MFTPQEIELLNDALNMAIKSNERMQTAKPRFNAVFAALINDLNALKHKVSQNSNTVAKK